MKRMMTILILFTLLTGCVYVQEDEINGKETFGVDYLPSDDLGNVILICDSELKVEYLFIKVGYGAGLTVRYNALGQPKECDY